jgi:hypothetical protein
MTKHLGSIAMMAAMIGMVGALGLDLPKRKSGLGHQNFARE